jgi:ABC-type multidrug transport system ATPase subunit
MSQVPATPVLECIDLCYNWPGGLALRNISFKLRPGELVLLTGDPGAGKSTLLKLLSARLIPASGSILFKREKLDPTRPSSRSTWRRRLGLLDQEQQLPAERTARELLQLVLAARGTEKSLRIRDTTNLLAETGQLALADRPVGGLSAGQKRWVQVALMLATRPDLLLLDEPFHHLGEEMRAGLWEWLKRLPETGTAVLLSTHQPQEAPAGQRRLVLAGGRLEERP